MTAEILQLAREVKLIRSGLPLNELIERSKLIDRLEKQFGDVKSDVKKFERVGKEAAKEAKNATKTANTLKGQIQRDVKRLGNEINSKTKPLQEAYKKVDKGVQRLTKGLDKFAAAAGLGFGIAGVIISFAALWTSERNQAAFDRQIDAFQSDMTKQGSFNQLIQNRFKKLRADFDAYVKKNNKTLDYQSQDIKQARRIADAAKKQANDITYEARVRLQKLNDITAQANSNASKALIQNTAIKQQVSAIDTKATKAATEASTARAGVRLVDSKATLAQQDASQARIGVRLVDSKATTALATAQQLPAKIPAFVAPVVTQQIAPIKAENVVQNQEIAVLKSKVTAIQNTPKTNTPTTNNPTTNTPTVNQAQVNQAVNQSITNMGIIPRLGAAETTAQTALARSTAALNRAEQEPIGNRALGLGANNTAAIAKLDQDIKQLKAPNLLEPRVAAVETKLRERESVDAKANQKLDQLVADRSKLEQLLVVTGGLALMAPQIINTLSPQIQALPGSTAAAVAAQPCNGKGCGGRTAARVDGISDELGALRQQVNSIPNTVGNVVNAGANAVQIPLLNTINSKLGAPVPGGIGGLLQKFSNSFEKFAEWAHLDRILNILTFTATVHNAYMLSNALTQTFFSMISNVLAAIGIKDKDKNPLDINKIVGQSIESLLKGMFGVTTIDGIKAEWKKYNTIYQAASNLLNSLQSIGYSILGSMEILGNWIASIGNALRRFGVVAERAYRIMNPEVNFQNRFFTAIDKAENIVSNIDQIAQEVQSIQETVGRLGTQKTELANAVGATQTIQNAENASKAASSSPAIAVTDLSKPES